MRWCASRRCLPVPDLEPPGLNLKQVARELGVHYKTAYRYVRQGQLPAWRSGSVWLVAPGDLAAFQASGAADRAPHGSAPHVDRLARHLALGDEVAAWAVLQQALGGGLDLDDAHLELLLGARRAARASVDGGGAPVVDPLVDRLLARLGAVAVRPGRARGVVAVVDPVGVRRDPAVAVVANLLRHRGLRVVEVVGGPGGAGQAPMAEALAALGVDRLVQVPASVTCAQVTELRALVADATAASPDARGA